ncbi:MAG: DUF4230 domain-containing protein [Anaerolineales bacterium]|nr:DUF4230 domain-containing protein [Anaerolineales bacterium]
MNKPAQRQYAVWGGIAAAALAGIALIAFFAGRLFTPPPPPTATPLPTPPPPVVTIQSIKAQAKLSTIEYNTVTEIYREEVPEGWFDELLGTKERLLMLVYGDVQAGFDLEKLKEEDLWTDGKRVRLVLPAPEILSTSIDFDRTHIVYYENNLILEDNNPNLQGEALEEAQKAIEEAALKEKILDKANTHGKLYYENFLRSLGFTDVEVVTNAQVFEE